MPESVWNRVRKHLNAHPKKSCLETQQYFKDENRDFVKRCYYDWKNYVEPLRNFYNVIIKKFEPVKKISEKDMRKIRKIEKILETEYDK